MQISNAFVGYGNKKLSHGVLAEENLYQTYQMLSKTSFTHWLFGYRMNHLFLFAYHNGLSNLWRLLDVYIEKGLVIK